MFLPKKATKLELSWNLFNSLLESDPVPRVERLTPLATGLSEAGIKAGSYPSDEEPTTCTWLSQIIDI